MGRVEYSPCRPPVGIPQTTPRPEEAPPHAAKRGQDQTRGDGQTARGAEGQTTKTSKLVHNISSTQWWDLGVDWEWNLIYNVEGFGGHDLLVVQISGSPPSRGVAEGPRATGPRNAV